MQLKIFKNKILYFIPWNFYTKVSLFLNLVQSEHILVLVRQHVKRAKVDTTALR
jgi:hypothetical protein